jgi:hypothetical protein
MFWVQLYGKGPDGKPGTDQIATPFPTLEAAIAKANFLAANNTFYWGKATGYKVIDDSKAVVHEATV